MDKHDISPEMTRLLRLQRHDFINHLQVIHGFLQLGKTERAMEYMENLCKDPAILYPSTAQQSQPPADSGKESL